VLLYAPYSENIYYSGKKLPNVLPWKIRQLGYYGLNTLLTEANIRDVEIYHPSYYGSVSSPSSYRKMVVTVYDLIHERYKGGVGIFDPTRKAKRSIVNKADAIIAISNSTKHDLIDIYGVDEKKICVIYPGVTTPQYFEESVLPDRFILYVGSRQGYKNFAFYLRAVADVLVKHNIFLVAFGGGAFNPGELSLLKELNVKDRVFHMHGNDSALFYCYKGALFTVFPSILEGFGFPIVEAFSMGCPVLTSNTSSMAEIAQGSALLVDPLDTAGWRRNTEDIINNIGLRKDLSFRGFMKARNFSWNNTAKQTLQLYESL